MNCPQCRWWERPIIIRLYASFSYKMILIIVKRRYMFISRLERKSNRLCKIEDHSQVSIWKLSREASTKFLGQRHLKRGLISEVYLNMKRMTPWRSCRCSIRVWECWTSSNLINRASQCPNGDTPKKQMGSPMDRLSKSLSIFTQKPAKVMEISIPLKILITRPKNKKSSPVQPHLEELLKPHLAFRLFILVQPTSQKMKSEKYGRNQEHLALERTKWIKAKRRAFITLF